VLPTQDANNQFLCPVHQWTQSILETCTWMGSLNILELGLGASERGVKLAYQCLTCIYHPHKWKQTHQDTSMRLPENTAHFQLLNNAQSFLRQHII
jgi:preprotein translocase subunit Sec63